VDEIRHTRALALLISPRIRLTLLLGFLGVLLFYLLSMHTGALSSSSYAGCLPSKLPQLESTDLHEIENLRARLLPVLNRAGGRHYAWGTITPQVMWSDNSPQPLAETDSGGLWPASYEIREWASGEDLVADVLEFQHPRQARDFLELASGVRCRRAAKQTPTAAPPRARNLLWLNPDGFYQEDVFLDRGTWVYRVAAVIASAREKPSHLGLVRTFRALDALACLLPASECSMATVKTSA
jgi:hypothetical protein